MSCNGGRIWFISLFLVSVVGSSIAAEPLDVALQARKHIEGGRYAIEVRRTQWAPDKTAIVVIDMWDDHHCKAAAQRVTEMAPVMNRTLEAARKRGVLIVHAPSDCADAYRGTPARQRAQAAPFAKAPAPFKWNHLDAKRDGSLARRLEEGGCSCDTPEPCGPSVRKWTKQHPGIHIREEDAVSADGQEIFNLFSQRGIENVVIMGVHTNRCILGRPFGIRQMVSLGKKVVLCRDLTDSYHRDPGKHFEGLRAICDHIEAHWCSTTTSESFTGKPAFRFAADKTTDG